MNDKRIINGLKGVISTCNWWAILFGAGYLFVYFVYPEERAQNHYGVWFIFTPLAMSGLIRAFVAGYEKNI